MGREGRLIEPKSGGGRRTVPIAVVLRDYLAEHRLVTGRPEGLVFGSSASAPFQPSRARERADNAWKAAGSRGSRSTSAGTPSPA